MPLRFAITLILAAAGLAATAKSEERHYLLYLSSTTACPFPSGVTNPANFQSVPGARPVLPPTSFTQNQSLARQLCFFNWNPAPSTTPAAEHLRAQSERQGRRGLPAASALHGCGLHDPVLRAGGGLPDQPHEHHAERDRRQSGGSGADQPRDDHAARNRGGWDLPAPERRLPRIGCGEAAGLERHDRAGREHLRQCRHQRSRGVRRRQYAERRPMLPDLRARANRDLLGHAERGGSGDRNAVGSREDRRDRRAVDRL